MKGLYSYTIDDNTAVTVTSNQTSTDQFDTRGFKVNPTFTYSLNVYNLTNGYHKIRITVGLTHQNDDVSRYINKDTPIQFFVQNPTPAITPSPEPTPTDPNMGPTAPHSPKPPLIQEQLGITLGAAITVAVIGAALGLLIYLIKRK